MCQKHTIMKRAILTTFSAYVCLVFEAVAQVNIDAIVNDAMQSTFPGVPPFGQIPASMYLILPHVVNDLFRDKIHLMSDDIFFSNIQRPDKIPNSIVHTCLVRYADFLQGSRSKSIFISLNKLYKIEFVLIGYFRII